MATKCLYIEMRAYHKQTYFYRHRYLHEGKLHLSRERFTVFTQLCSNLSMTLKPEFVFEGKGIRTDIHPLESIDFNLASNRPYGLEQMLCTIFNLQNRFNIFTPKNHATYVLDNYSVHFIPEIKENS